MVSNLGDRSHTFLVFTEHASNGKAIYVSETTDIDLLIHLKHVGKNLDLRLSLQPCTHDIMMMVVTDLLKKLTIT